MKSIGLIEVLLIIAFLAGCDPYRLDSQNMSDAFETAQLVYGNGENDTLLFIPELDKASAYYADKKDYGKAALAALYHGYAEMDYDKAEAMKAFSDAKQYGLLVNDSLTMARAQYQMGKMLYSDYMHEEALAMFRKAEEFFGCHYREKALALNAEACLYILLKDYDEADSCLKKAQILAEQGHSRKAQQKVLNNYALLYHLQGAYEKTIDCLRRVAPENNQQRLLNNLNLGNTYAVMDMMDSARYYYNKMEELLTQDDISEESVASAYQTLSQFAELQGDNVKALAYLKEDLRFVVKVKDRVERKNIYRIQQQFNYEALRNRMNENIIARQRIITALALTITLILLSFVVLLKRLSKIEKQEVEARKRILFYVSQYTELLTQQGKAMQKLALVIDHREDKSLLENLKATVFGKKDPWDALMKVFDTLYPNIREGLRHWRPKLTDLEQKDIILSYFNVSRQDESLMLNISIHSVDKLRISTREKTQNGAKKPEKNQ